MATIRVCDFFHNLCFWVFRFNFESLSFVTIWYFECCKTSVFEFCHYLSFRVLSQIQLLSFDTIWVFFFKNSVSFVTNFSFLTSTFINDKKFFTKYYTSGCFFITKNFHQNLFCPHSFFSSSHFFLFFSSSLLKIVHKFVSLFFLKFFFFLA